MIINPLYGGGDQAPPDGRYFVGGTLPVQSRWTNRCSAYGNGKFVLLNKDYFLYSNNGTTWSQATKNFSLTSDCIVTYGDKFVGAVSSGSSSNEFFYSDTGTSWVKGTLPVSAYWNSIVYCNGKYALWGDSGKSLLSSDGINWTDNSYSLPADIPSHIFNGGNKFIGYGLSRFFYSDDAINWTMTSSTHESSTIGYMQYGKGIYVYAGKSTADGNCVIYYSSDAITWTKATDHPTISGFSEGAITYYNGKFVIMRFNGNFYLYSTNGINWTVSNLPVTFSNINTLSAGNGIIIAADYGGNFVYSRTTNDY